ncbi:molybdopterin molybdotransferase MoeA [Nonomuraea zeae]|uniref:Molybdopterin molybdenumtransferase n=2 Tax=Nonomuraea zeae TaxID=1642303 RepID=A0A5S4H3S0_9ACTN|nr:molybdopterin molybdotransferase MoeA [Nonomuraea zeae]
MSWTSARALAAEAACPLEPVPVPLDEALGSRLAVPLRALVAVPGADVSAMDGYAVAGDGPWRVVGRVLAGGAVHAAELRPGEAVEIATGAPVPGGAEAVVPWERVTIAPASGGSASSGPVSGGPVSRMRAARVPAWGDDVWIEGAVEVGRHIRRRGEDIAEGAVVLGAGTVVTPVALGLAAGLGHDVLLVRPRPRVTVLVTGDEVVQQGLPGPGRVRDAIGPFLPGLVEWAGGRIAGTLRLPDGAHPLHDALALPSRPATAPPGPASASPGAAFAPASAADVLVVCGASAKGPADHLRKVLGDLGADVLIDGVAVRPGHPQLLARLPGGRLLVGLPGNPFAALAAALTLLAPILRELAGTPVRHEASALAGEVRAHPHDTRLVPVRRSGRGAVPVGHDRPGSLWGAALADALAAVPPGWAGEQVELIELPAGV